ncbi:MAG: hypothetical protein RQ866_01010 [Bacteroidales bacterium]|nr:hypothetical protein [Bacteroidales bacterium]
MTLHRSHSNMGDVFHSYLNGTIHPKKRAAIELKFFEDEQYFHNFLVKKELLQFIKRLFPKNNIS